MTTTTIPPHTASEALATAADLIVILGWNHPDMTYCAGELNFLVEPGADLPDRLTALDKFASITGATTAHEQWDEAAGDYWGRIYTRGGNAAGVPAYAYIAITITEAHDLGLVRCPACEHPSHDNESQCLAGVWVDGLEATICGCAGADTFTVPTHTETAAETHAADQAADAAAGAL